MSIKLAVPCLLLLAGPAAAADPLPATIAAPGETVVLSVHAEGAQVYECKAGTDGKLAWAFREPIATLLSEGKTVGRHYAGPNWEHADGSAVAAKGRRQRAGRDAGRYSLAEAGSERPPRQRRPHISHDGSAHQHPWRQARRRLRQGRRVQERALFGRIRLPEEGLRNEERRPLRAGYGFLDLRQGVQSLCPIRPAALRHFGSAAAALSAHDRHANLDKACGVETG
ncbi:hypothetical protein ACVW0I_005424 [Bradyrhizobium sp. LM6.11]